MLGGAYTYETVESVTTAALAATGTTVSNENFSRAWSAVLKVTDGVQGVAPMDVMSCVANTMSDSGFDFPEAAALCATMLHSGG
ncbi:hypothetical protein FHS08_001381 [Microbacterium ulmi]|nr:hypothetical protein [Microbacterium ulmi]